MNSYFANAHEQFNYMPAHSLYSPQYDDETDASFNLSNDNTFSHPPWPLTIQQLDGPMSPPPATHSPAPVVPNPISAVQPPVARVRFVNHTLDRNKQLKKLLKDTAVKDFSIEVSKTKQNVNICCNTGFYTKVAVPALHSLTAGQVKVFQGVSVQCQDIVGNFDATQAQQTTIIYFRLSQDKLSLGGVRIHLHHTKRLIQLQGGAILPDQRTAPVWFVDHVLRSHFSQLSSEKSIDISEFNMAVSNMVTSHLTSDRKPDICGGCKVQFNGRSSPELCSECDLFYHKCTLPSPPVMASSASFDDFLLNLIASINSWVQVSLELFDLNRAFYINLHFKIF